MEREYIGYLIIVAMILLAVGGVFLARYHSHARTYGRTIKRERAAYDTAHGAAPQREV